MKTFKYTALLILIVSQSILVRLCNVENLPVKNIHSLLGRRLLIKQGSCKRNDGKWEYTGSCIGIY
jgi:hypothetical protein